jgi:electron transport complex protein RnfG
MKAPISKTSQRLRLGYPGLLLGVAVLLATTLLAIGHLATREAIAERLEEDLKASLEQVIPAKHYDNDLLAAPLLIERRDQPPVTVYRARSGRQITGVAYSVVAPDGYSGSIQMMLGVAPDGRVLGVRVLAHGETPGLGDKLELAKNDWILDFDGLSLTSPASDQWRVKKDGGHFDQFTGATITPRAVVKAVKRGLEFYAVHRETLNRPDAPTPDPSVSKVVPKATGSGD